MCSRAALPSSGTEAERSRCFVSSPSLSRFTLGGSRLDDFDARSAAELRGYWDELEPHIAHLGDAAERERVEFALRVAYQAHQGQKRKSGEPYIIHPVAVGPRATRASLALCM